MAEICCPHCLRKVAMASGSCPYCGGDVSMQNSAAQLQVGTVLGGRSASYLVGKVIGSGGFGQTYLAHDLTHNRRVAIKEYYPKRCNPQRDQQGNVRPTTSQHTIYRDGMKSFLTEATMLKALNDIKGIVNVFDYFESLGTAYMVMEYVVGETLRASVERRGAMEAQRLLASMLPLMRDIAAINDAGVLHRDINPQNIIVMPSGELRLIDFGCARSVEDGKSMEVLMTPGFAPPEQYSRKGQGPYTDVYGLCATIYYCVTATIPPDSNERVTEVYNGREDPIVWPSRMGVTLPAGVETVLMRGLETQKEKRFQTMDELADALAPLVVGRNVPITVRPVNLPNFLRYDTTKTGGTVQEGRRTTTKEGKPRKTGWLTTTTDKLSKVGRDRETTQKQAQGQSTPQRQAPPQQQMPQQRSQQKPQRASQQRVQARRAAGPVRQGGMSREDQTTTIILIVLVVLSALGIIAIIASMQPASTGSTSVTDQQTAPAAVGDVADDGWSSGDAQVTYTQNNMKKEPSAGRKVKPSDSYGISMPV